MLSMLVVVAALIFIFLKTQFLWDRFKVNVGFHRVRIYLMLMGCVLVVSYLVQVFGSDLFIVERILGLADGLQQGGLAEERTRVYAAAIQDFLHNPIFGSSYLVSYGRSSPHNIVIESLISGGLIGFVLLIFTFWILVNQYTRQFSGHFGHQGLFVAMVSLFLVMFGMTSLSIGQSPELWIMLACCLNFSSSKAK
tara:strand:- start:76 stop:660 length:585 start_codon:yes stop_codon:yes gene_type:complete